MRDAGKYAPKISGAAKVLFSVRLQAIGPQSTTGETPKARRPRAVSRNCPKSLQKFRVPLKCCAKLFQGVPHATFNAPAFGFARLREYLHRKSPQECLVFCANFAELSQPMGVTFLRERSPESLQRFGTCGNPCQPSKRPGLGYVSGLGAGSGRRVWARLCAGVEKEQGGGARAWDTCKGFGPWAQGSGVCSKTMKNKDRPKSFKGFQNEPKRSTPKG